MTSMQVLLVDDELHSRNVLNRYLTNEGFHVLEASNGTCALHRVLQNRIGLVVLEIDLPGQDGLELCAKIRNENDTPVLVLTGKENEKDVIRCFEAGADDFVFKPFSPREVVHRISAIIRRRTAQVCHAASSSIIVSDICLDPKARKVKVKGVEVELTLKEYDLIYYLINHVGQTLSREQLISEVWHYSHQGDCRTVDTHIKRLREKMNAAATGSGHLIQTVRRVGYTMNGRA